MSDVFREFDEVEAESCGERLREAAAAVAEAQDDLLDFMEDLWARRFPGVENPYSPERRAKARSSVQPAQSLGEAAYRLLHARARAPQEAGA